MRTKILDYQRQFFAEARKEAQGSKAIVFGDEKDASKVFHLAEILERHKIKFHEIASDFSKDGKTFKKGYGYVIPTNQKQHRLVKAMFEKRTKFQDSLFYDISAWTFPLAFNLDYSEDVTMTQAGDEVINLKIPKASAPEVSNYAYIMEWHDYYAPKALNLILKKGLRAKVGMTKFSLENNDDAYGSILIPVQNQNLDTKELADFLSEVATISHVTIKNVNTGLTKGIDLGSGDFRALELPRIALLVGEGVNSYDAGEMWHLFDQRYDMTITKLDTKNFSPADLSRYTDIILPSMWGNALNKKQAEKLKTWVTAGGTVIGYKNSGNWLSSNEFLGMEFIIKKDSAINISFEQRGDYRGAQVIGGAIFNTKLDRSHPIAFGYKNDYLPMFRNSTLFLKPEKDSYNNPIKYTNSPLLGGYISEPNLEQLKNTVPFKTQELGRGQVVYFTDNTNFRAFWYGTNKLLMNAIFFGDEM